MMGSLSTVSCYLGEMKNKLKTELQCLVRLTAYYRQVGLCLSLQQPVAWVKDRGSAVQDLSLRDGPECALVKGILCCREATV